jgi:hypothetical protein
MDEIRPSLPSWAVVAAALLVPILLAVFFLTALEWSNGSLSRGSPIESHGRP